MKSIYSNLSTTNVPVTTSLAKLTDVTITSPLNGQVLEYSAGRWINANNTVSPVQSVFNRVGNVSAQANDYEISEIENNSYLASSINVQVSSPNPGETIRYNGLKYLNSKLSLNDLSNTSVSSSVEADSLIYSVGQWQNQKKYSEYFNYVNVNPGDTITADSKTIYFTNLATINFGASSPGESIRIINTNGPLLTINFPGRILYFNFNNFNATLTTTESCFLEFQGILGGNWQLMEFSGKILNSVTGKNLCNNDINDLRNVIISSPSVGQVISWNGSNFVNSSLPSTPVLSVFGRTGNIVATEGDYSLNLLSDCSVSSALPNQILKYNGSNFTNSFLLDNSYTVNTSCNSGAVISAVINTTYVCNLGTLNIGNSSSGACIKIINNGSTLTINFSGLVYINGVNYFNTSFTSNELMYMEIKNYFNGSAWIVTNLTPRIFYPTTSRFLYYCVSDINDLRNVSITSPSVGQVISYNGSNFVNSSLPSAPITSVFSRTGNVTASSGDYSISQITNASVLADSNNLNINTPLNNQVLTYNTATSKWINQNASSSGVSSFNTRTGAVTIQSGDVNINQLGNVNLVSPVLLDTLRFDGTNWTNQKVNHFWTCNSAGNLSNNQFVFFNGFGQSATEAFTQMYITQTITITKMDVYLQTPPGGATARTFNLRVTASTLASVTISGANQFGSSSFIINPVAGSFLSLQNVNTGSPANGTGLINITYNFR